MGVFVLVCVWVCASCIACPLLCMHNYMSAWCVLHHLHHAQKAWNTCVKNGEWLQKKIQINNYKVMIIERVL